MTRPPEIVDSHCHLDFADFDGERDAVIARAVTTVERSEL